MTAKISTSVIFFLLATGWFVDLWLTPDQQGRWAFEEGDYANAAERFEDPYWKGISYYRNGDYENAINQFVLLQTAQAYFYVGNSYARLEGYPAAVKNYDQALLIQPNFPEAEENRQLILALIEEEKKEDPESNQQVDPTFNPDEIQFDEKGEKGKEGEIEESLFSEEQITEIWMRNIQTSPADYLRFKFRIQAQDKETKP